MNEANEDKNIKQILDYSDLSDLPIELIEQLSISNGKKTYYELINFIKQSGGRASIDQLLIMIYKKTGEIRKRKSLVAQLYRMERKCLVKNNNGVYSCKQ